MSAIPQMPYLPATGRVAYVPASDPMMAAARAVRDASGCVKQRTGAVIVSPGGRILGRGNNDTEYDPGACPRDVAGYGTGQGYHLCQDACGQMPGRHAERDAILAARESGGIESGSVLYLSGHWWCCEPCWTAMLAEGVSEVRLLEGVGPDTDWGSV